MIQAPGGQTIPRRVEIVVGTLEVMTIAIGTAAEAVGILEVVIVIGIVAEAGIPEATAEVGTAMAVIVAAGEKGRYDV
jgi:hypothetical protein